jgi:fumarate reductase flavoprotein subunit
MPKETKELKADVVVIGTGAAGLCTALTAGLGGANVIVLEKMHARGGMSNFAEAMFAVESKLQKRLKYGLTVDQAFKSHMENCHWQPNGRLVRAFMEKTADTIDWLQNLGVVFTDVKAIYPDGPRVWHFIKDLSALGLIRPLSERIKTIPNIQVLTETPLTKILREKGKISGVMAQDKAGNAFRIDAKAVVIATGGYQSNPEWMAKYCKAGQYIKAAVPSKQFGEPIQMAWDVGAAEDGLGVLQAFPFVPGERHLGSRLLHAGTQPYLWINKRGERFCDESIGWRFPIICNAMARQPEAMAFCIYDENTKNYLKEEGVQYTLGEFMKPGDKLVEIDSEIEDGIREGKVFQADTLKELAARLNMPAAVLKSTVDEYNKCCEDNVDWIFGKHRMYMQRISSPKFYAFTLNIVALISEGGIKINHRMEVIDNEWDVIPGLYAAGCCVGGLVGETYNLDTTGGSISFACNSGRMAGESLLKYLDK